MEIQLCRFEYREEKAWDNYIYQSHSGAHCHLSGWQRVIHRAYGHRGFYLWAHEGGEIKGVLPLILIRSVLFGRSLVSLPFLDDGGVCSDDNETRIGLYLEAFRLFEEYKANFLDLRHRQPSGLELLSHGSKVTLILELADDPDQMWKRFNAKLRNQIRKAMRSDLSVSWHRCEGLSDFYEVFVTNMRDLGSPVHSQRFFAAILEEFRDSARLLLVRKGSRTIGGGLCFLFKDTILMPWASSQREYFSLCPNNILYWEVIQWGCQQGYRRFDFGRSSPGSGTYHFKKQWGAIEEPLHWQCLSRKGDQASVIDSRDLRYQWAIRVWQYIPLAITKRLGPILRRQMTN